MNRKLIAALGAAGALTLGAIPALAQDDTGTATEQSQSTREEVRAEREAAFAQALADELGLDVDDVSTALTNVREQMKAEHDAARAAALQERLDEAVANGDLTQEQADAIVDAAEAGVLPGPGRRGHHGPRGSGGDAPSGDAV